MNKLDEEKFRRASAPVGPSTEALRNASNTNSLQKLEPPKEIVLSIPELEVERTDCVQGNTDNITDISNKAICSSEKSVDVKDMLTQLLVARLWVVLLLTFMFTMLMLTAAYLTCSLTLRVEAFHAMYNLFTLFGFILAIKLCRVRQSLQNTFGWARLEVLTSLSTLIFLGGLCFGVAVDSMQASFRVGHQDNIQYAGGMVWLGFLGLLLNAFVYVLIGGYSNHQGCQYEKKESGIWPKEERITRSLSSPNIKNSKPMICEIQHQSLSLVFRDISGLILVIGCGGIVVWDEQNTFARYTDPILALFSVALLLALSYPYARDCIHILLLTIPDNIDIGLISAHLLDNFPDVLNVHHIHIWSLNPGKVVATAHVVMVNPSVYMKIGSDLRKFFHDQGINEVTIQPEFLDGYRKKVHSAITSTGCLLSCNHTCKGSECCVEGDDLIAFNKGKRHNFTFYADDYSGHVSDSDNNIIININNSDESIYNNQINNDISFHRAHEKDIPLRSLSCQFNLEKPCKSSRSLFIESEKGKMLNGQIHNLKVEQSSNLLSRSVPDAMKNPV